MNSAGVAGGAIFAQTRSSVTIVDSVIEANYAETDGNKKLGGENLWGEKNLM